MPTAITITPGSRRDWPTFAQWHPRSASLGPSRGIWLAHRPGVSRPVGIIVYAPPTRAMAAWTKSNLPLRDRLRALNDSTSVIARLVVHPDHRSIGVGAALVVQTLPLALAALAAPPQTRRICVVAAWVTPFVRAGMVEGPTRPISRAKRDFLRRLAALGIDPCRLRDAADWFALPIVQRAALTPALRALIRDHCQRRATATVRQAWRMPDSDRRLLDEVLTLRNLSLRVCTWPR